MRPFRPGSKRIRKLEKGGRKLCDCGPPFEVVFQEQDGIDYAPSTVQMPGGERVPFLFTVRGELWPADPHSTEAIIVCIGRMRPREAVASFHTCGSGTVLILGSGVPVIQVHEKA